MGGVARHGQLVLHRGQLFIQRRGFRSHAGDALACLVLAGLDQRGACHEGGFGLRHQHGTARAVAGAIGRAAFHDGAEALDPWRDPFLCNPAGRSRRCRRCRLRPASLRLGRRHRAVGRGGRPRGDGDGPSPCGGRAGLAPSWATAAMPMRRSWRAGRTAPPASWSASCQWAGDIAIEGWPGDRDGHAHRSTSPECRCPLSPAAGASTLRALTCRPRAAGAIWPRRISLCAGEAQIVGRGAAGMGTAISVGLGRRMKWDLVG